MITYTKYSICIVILLSLYLFIMPLQAYSAVLGGDKANDSELAEITAIQNLLLTHHSAKKHIFGSIGMPTWPSFFPAGTAVGTSSIAKWKFGKQSALTISYDDSAIGNALHGVPQMKRKSLVGTWFVNPGSTSFQKMTDVWHKAVSKYNQEVANHTMNHAGGVTESEALASINDASNYIKEHIYVLPITTKKLLGFNKAGGTNWDIPTTGEAWEQRIRDNHLIEREYSTGFYKAMPFSEMEIVVKAKSFGTGWSSIHFHGICDDLNDGKNNPAYSPSYIETCTCTHIPPDCPPEPAVTEPDYQALWLDWVNCRFSSGYNKAIAVNDCKDGGTGAVKKSEIYSFYDFLADPTEIPAQQIWIAGFIAAKKYEIQRNNASITVLSASPTQIEIRLELASIAIQVPLNQLNLYGEELTLFTKLPSDWQACKVTQNGQSYTYRIANSEARFEAIPNNGIIRLQNDAIANINVPYVGD